MKTSTKILTNLGFVLGLILLILGIASKEMSLGWYISCILSGVFLIVMFKDSQTNLWRDN